MACQPRFILPGYPQHVIQRSNNRHVIFADDTGCRFYMEKLHEVKGDGGIAFYSLRPF